MDLREITFIYFLFVSLSSFFCSDYFNYPSHFGIGNLLNSAHVTCAAVPENGCFTDWRPLLYPVLLLPDWPEGNSIHKERVASVGTMFPSMSRGRVL
jgi:hypothetical protein